MLPIPRPSAIAAFVGCVAVLSVGIGTRSAEAVTLATRTGLDGSAGSDFHDPAIAWNPPGRLAKLPALLRPVWASPPFPRDFGCS